MSSSSSFFSLTALTLLLKTIFIGPAVGSPLFTITVWTARLITISLLFRTFLGPTILRLISKRLRARSVSLRSIRGISFRSSAGVWRIDRIGLSYSRPSGRGCSRFAVKVEGVKLELQPEFENGQRSFDGRRGFFRTAKSTSSVLTHGFTSVTRSIYDYAYWVLDPYVRPMVRSAVVTIFRLVIRALPTLVQALDFELESAIVTFSADVDAKLSVARAKLDMRIALDKLGLPQVSEKPAQPVRHKRFASVANMNARLKNSLKRTWDKAWGGTEVAASVCLNVGQILVTSRDCTRDDFNTSIAERLTAETPCLDIPNIAFSVSAKLDPHRGLQQHSLETSLKLDPITLDMDTLSTLMDAVKRQMIESKSTVHSPSVSSSPIATPASIVTTPPAVVRSMSSPPTFPASIIARPTSPSPSLSSLKSWRSSMGAISASIKFRRNPHPQSNHKSRKEAVPISILKSVHLEIPRLVVKHTVKSSGRTDLACATFDKIIVIISRSHPERNQLHREWMGRSSAPEDPLTGDVYSTVFSIHGTSVVRIGSGPIREHLRIVELGPLSMNAVVSQWPSPWLRSPTFFDGDPNNQWLLLKINLEHIDISEHLEVLRSYLTTMQRRNERLTSSSGSSLPVILSPTPRLQLSLGVGPICARLISPASLATDRPFAIEARTEGIVADIRTHFVHHADKREGKQAILRDFPRTHLRLGLDIVLQRTFVNVCGSQWEDIPAGPGLPAGQPLLSLDDVHFTGKGSALGEVVDDPMLAVSIDVPSAFLDLAVYSDALSVELWQPDAIGAITTVLQVFAAVQRAPPITHTTPNFILDSLPSGLSLSFALSRAMVFITGPDLSPGEELEISRGVASHVGIVVTYCYLKSSQKDTASFHLSHEQQRLLLSLPSNLLPKAHDRISAIVSDQSPMALIQVKTWDIAFRDAIATRLIADDLFGVGDHHHHYRQQEYLNIRSIAADIVISGQRQNSTALPSSKDDCVVTITIEPISGTLHLANVYNGLLALQTVHSLLRSTASSGAGRGASKPSVSTLSVGLTCEFSRLQLIYDCPLSSKVYLRLDNIFAEVSASQTIIISYSSLVMATLLDVEHDGVKQTKWEEVLRLLEWRTVVQPDLSPVGVVADGQSALIRIPFQFVLADLILDMNVSVKCIKHLLRMVPSGRFSNSPIPEAEGPKKMPDLVVRVGMLNVEAADEAIESRLALIWRAGAEAARLRMERDDAFEAKVATIVGARTSTTSQHGPDSDYTFSAEHSVSVQEAYERLHFVHSGAWKSRFRQAHVAQSRRQESLCRKSHSSLYKGNDLIVQVNPPSSAPPLFRITFDGLSLHLARPSFALNDISEFLHTQGGLPRDTEYSLLMPMHLGLSVSSFRIALREYPLPLVNVPRHSKGDIPGLIFDTDLIIAEEMILSEKGVEWVECAIVKAHRGIQGASPLSIAVPKTLNPVKTYANPVMRVTTDDITDLSWGVSYSPAMQDFMRVIDTLSHSPRDSSPAIGFWDKLRLIFHWSMKIHFSDEVHLHLKGSRNPYDLRDVGAGFALCWKGHPHILVGQPNEQNELIQAVSDTMLITIPNIEQSYGETATMGAPIRSAAKPEIDSGYRIPHTSKKSRKVIAKLSSGVRFGIGFVLERVCGSECPKCLGSAFQRHCRLFEFRPHYEVMLEKKAEVPLEKSSEDSYNGFRSDFIHMSISLTSSIDVHKARNFSSIHLSPGLFSHFWAWWTLFDTISLPIRQGRRYKHKRPLSPKFGQHLATIKYRFSIPKLFISHAYMDQSSDAWADGVTPFVGTKAMIDHFQADMHQRAQETTITAPDGMTKTTMHKPFSAIEVVLKGLELRALLAIFSETLKQSVPLECSPIGSTYRNRETIPVIEPDSPWIDLDDFVETDWTSSGAPILHLLPVVSCPRFTYFRRASPASANENRVEVSKFDNEDTHLCLLGSEASVPQVQLDLVTKRIQELYELRDKEKKPNTIRTTFKTKTDVGKMITLLEDYAKHLAEVAATSRRMGPNGPHSYYMPSDSVSPEEWAEFQNVYQVHCPQIYMDNIIRDILIQYYYCSVARRGIEYHMATRAVKFIRDQAKTAVENLEAEAQKQPAVTSSAQAAAMAVRKMFIGENAEPTVEKTEAPLEASDPMVGWDEGVFLRKSHFCLLLKPQIVLRSETSAESVLIMAAVHGKLQTYGIMDTANADDPVSGRVMTRNFASITGLQSFSPSAANTSGEGCVPLEVLVDLRCDNSLFDRLVPQTNASLHYDKFNRLRLRNNVTSVARTARSSDPSHNHLNSQTDLIRFHVPRFTVSANDHHFQAISNIVTDLLLFSNAALKTRSDRLEKMLFSYDFTNVASAADVVADLQSRLRHSVEMKREAEWKLLRFGEEGEVEKLKINAHILLLSEELNFVFDAIKLAQDKVNNRTGQNSALLLHASSAEISWRMLDRLDQLLAKLAVREIDFHWLSRQDSSIVNNLVVGDLQAFDGAADAEWTEILSKYEEKSNHPLVKQKLFLLADWTVLPPVGGITIYEAFDLSFHPMCLQIDTRVGKKIMEYVWPARRTRKELTNDPEENQLFGPPSPTSHGGAKRTSLDVMSPTSRRSTDSNRLAPTPLRSLNTSRSYTDLRAERSEFRSEMLQVHRPLTRTKSSDGLFALSMTSPSPHHSAQTSDELRDKLALSKKARDDAAEMKTRSSQKTFVWVRVSSLHLVLSILKEDSFLCRDARIKTRDLEYRNQTWSFEELVDQFIPSGKNWKGWVKIAFQQPLVPVLPVARELITKTKWGTAKPHAETVKRKGGAKRLPLGGSRDATSDVGGSDRRDPQALAHHTPSSSDNSVDTLSGERESTREEEGRRRHPRTRVMSLFKRSRSQPRGSVDSDVSTATSGS